MRNVVVGSFMGFVLAAAFLAACGSGGGDDGSAPAPVPVSTPSQEKWSALGATHTVVTGVNLSRNVVWTGTTIYDNSVAGLRNQYACFEIFGNIESFAQGVVTIDIGVLPAPNGVDFATDPEWLGTVSLPTANNRRAMICNVRIPPTKCKFALRLNYGVSVTARVSRFTLTPYSAELQ